MTIRLRNFLVCFILLLAVASSTAALAQSVADEALGIVDERPFSARVLGGREAEAGEYPSMAALVHPGFRSLKDRLFCGGTVVAERWVLTAAHCVYDAFGQPLQPAFIRVVTGIRDLALETPESELQVVQVVIHPDYDNTLDLPPNDIALLELESPTTVPVATLFAGDSDEYTDALGFIAGWGVIDNSDEDNPEYPTVLHDAIVPIVSDEECNSPQSYDGYIVKSHLCAGYADGKVDACAGDSGGPLFIMVDGVQVQAAITSFGIGCGLPLFYGIYTDVSYFIQWLGDYIPVPEQSMELIIARAAEDNPMYTGSGSGDAVMTGGSAGYLGLVALVNLLMSRVGRGLYSIRP